MARRKRFRINKTKLQRRAHRHMRRTFSPKSDPVFNDIFVSGGYLCETLYICWKVDIYCRGIPFPVGYIEFSKDGRLHFTTHKEVVLKRILKEKAKSQVAVTATAETVFTKVSAGVAPPAT